MLTKWGHSVGLGCVFTAIFSSHLIMAIAQFARDEFPTKTNSKLRDYHILKIWCRSIYQLIERKRGGTRHKKINFCLSPTDFPSMFFVRKLSFPRFLALVSHQIAFLRFDPSSET